MMILLKPIDPNSIQCNPFTKLSQQWALVSAGSPDKFNMMTVSWGALGVIWGKPSVTAYIRQTRYTKQFMDENDTFVLTFLQDGHRDVLNVLGSRSGRDMDKMQASGLTPVPVEGGVTFAQAELVLVCRKRFVQDMPKESFMEQETLDKWYADQDYHTMYIGEIVTAYQAEQA